MTPRLPLLLGLAALVLAACQRTAPPPAPAMAAPSPATVGWLARVWRWLGFKRRGDPSSPGGAPGENRSTMNQLVRPQKIGASACPHDCPSTCALEVELLDERAPRMTQHHEHVAHADRDLRGAASAGQVYRRQVRITGDAAERGR